LWSISDIDIAVYLEEGVNKEMTEWDLKLIVNKRGGVSS